VPSVLIVEPHAPTAEFVARAVQDAGFEPIPASPAEAWEAFAARHPGLVILAADVPDGPALVQRLREADPRVLVIAADREHLGKAKGLKGCLPLKANGYVADPTKRDLAEKLRQLSAQAAQARPKLRGAALVLSRPPGGHGEVRPGVVPQVLVRLWRSMADGILVLSDGGSEERLHFLRGAPVAYDSDDPADSLLRRLKDSGRMDDEAHRLALDALAGGLSPGAALIAAGVLEPGESLVAALRAHVRAMTLRAVGAKKGRWRFHDGGEFAAQVPPAEVLPLPAILDGARAHLPVKLFSDALKPVGDAFPVRTAEFQRLLPALALGSADLRIALSIEGRVTTTAWLEDRKRELKDALALVWFLSALGAVAFQEVPADDGAAGPYRAAPARRKKPLPPERADAIRQAALQILPGSHYHALGVDITATTDDVERAYNEVATRFHPDGLAEYEVGDLGDLLEAIQAKVGAAYRVLGNEEKRKGYLDYLLVQFQLSGARHVKIDVEAEIALKQGEKALRESRFAEAVRCFRDAAERNPREPEYLAMLAFACLHDPVLPPLQRAEESRKAAKRALSLRPDHVRALSILALAEEAMGHLDEARRTVLDALRAHPGHEVPKAVLHRLNVVRK
jgi:tetratricopeptide (TPR) repeat protein/DNA-binding NarL/FixJ family response regulator